MIKDKEALIWKKITDDASRSKKEICYIDQTQTGQILQGI